MRKVGAPRPVHFVGSISLPSAAAVFECVCRHLGDHLTRISDGETGERGLPLPLRDTLVKSISGAAGLAYKCNWYVAGLVFPLFELASGFKAADIQFGPLGFATAAAESYKTFRALRDAGKIPVGVKMQVSIPTPLMLGLCFTAPEAMPVLWAAYEGAMQREIQALLTAIPATDLAIQWDMSCEFHEVLEGRNRDLIKVITRGMLVAAAARITDAVPAGVEVGWHFCYGDTGSEEGRETIHVVEPHDTRVMVEFANDVCEATARSVDWVHMPVPRQRDDAAYYAPLKDLRLKPGMQLFLGLLHKYDGVAGARRRAAAAIPYFIDFGVATECGMGRRLAADIPGLLDLHREAAIAL
jgi:hypothetical protein